MAGNRIVKILFLLPVLISAGVSYVFADRNNRAPVVIESFVSPYQRQSINLENAINSLRLRFGDRLRIKMFFPIAYDENKNAFTAASGENEVAETFRQAYIYNNYPDNFWSYVIARNQDIYNTEWAQYARFAGLDAGRIESLSGAVNNAGIREILKSDGKQAGQMSVSEFPALFVNGRQINDLNNLPNIASYINSLLPPSERLPGLGVSDYSEPSKIKVFAVSNLYGWGSGISAFKNAFPEIAKISEIETVDYREQAGQEFIKKYNLDFLPSFLIEKPSKTGKQKLPPPEIASMLKRGSLLDKKGGDYYLVPPSAIVFGLYLSRPLVENKLEVFVMSFCPWGIQTLLKLTQAYDISSTSKEQVRFHYIAETAVKNPKTLADFTALHGVPEVEENVRQLVIQKYMPAKFSAYIKQRTQNMESTLNIGEAFAAAGIDPAFVTDKMEKEGVELLLADIGISKQFNITESPSFLWQNRILLDVESFNSIPKFKDLITLKGSCKK